MANKHKYYIVKYIFHKDTHYSYKMFDELKNATDYLLELTNQGLKGKLYEAKEVEVTYKVEIK